MPNINITDEARRLIMYAAFMALWIAVRIYVPSTKLHQYIGQLVCYAPQIILMFKLFSAPFMPKLCSQFLPKSITCLYYDPKERTKAVTIMAISVVPLVAWTQMAPASDELSVMSPWLISYYGFVLFFMSKSVVGVVAMVCAMLQPGGRKLSRLLNSCQGNVDDLVTAQAQAEACAAAAAAAMQQRLMAAQQPTPMVLVLLQPVQQGQPVPQQQPMQRQLQGQPVQHDGVD